MSGTLTVKQLRESLAPLQDDMTVRINAVSNLVVVTPEGDYAGYIDFQNGIFYRDERGKPPVRT